jgi:hypothetical protein
MIERKKKDEHGFKRIAVGGLSGGYKRSTLYCASTYNESVDVPTGVDVVPLSDGLLDPCKGFIDESIVVVAAS